MIEKLVLPKKVRKYLYPIAIAAVALLVSHGVITETDASLWVGMVAAILGLGVAENHLVESETLLEEKFPERYTEVIEDDYITHPKDGNKVREV